MVEVVEMISSFSKGFELLWTINNIESLTDSWKKKSPIFEAFSRRWEMLLVSCQGPNNDYKLFGLYLNLLNNEGNIVEKIDISKNDSFFTGSQTRASFSFFNKDGRNLAPHSFYFPIRNPNIFIHIDVIQKTSLKTRTMHMFSAEFYLDDETIEKIFQERNKDGNTDFFIQMCFELRVLLANRNPSPAKVFPTINREKLFTEGKFSDFTILTGDGRKIRVHRAILDAAYGYFEAMFAHGGLEAQNAEISVPEPFSVINEIIRFLYTGKAPEKDQFGADMNILELYIAADKYQVTALQDHLRMIFDSVFSIESVCDDLVKAHMEGVECIKKKAVEFIRLHQKKVVGTEGFRQLCCSHPTLTTYVFAGLETKSIVELYPVAKKFQLSSFKDFLENTFEALLSPENVSDELIRVHIRGIDSLKKKAANLIRSRRDEVFETEGWIQLCKNQPKLVAFIFAK